eukprot:COSAG02_NODE_5802_length_4026_cov_4.072320_4_plen_85_part_00
MHTQADTVRLLQIVELAHKYDALTMVDDAHGEGVLGHGGRGVVNHFGLEGQVTIIRAHSCVDLLDCLYSCSWVWTARVTCILRW